MHSILRMLRKKRRAAKIIFEFMRKNFMHRQSPSLVKSIFRKGSGEGKGSKGILKHRTSEFSLDGSSHQRMGRRLSDPAGGLGLKLKRFSDTINRQYTTRHISIDFDNNHDRSTDLSDLETLNEVSEISRDRAEESYKIMQRNEGSGEVCIMERCFIVMETTLEELSLMFHVLQIMIDFERKVSKLIRHQRF